MSFEARVLLLIFWCLIRSKQAVQLVFDHVLKYLGLGEDEWIWRALNSTWWTLNFRPLFHPFKIELLDWHEWRLTYLSMSLPHWKSIVERFGIGCYCNCIGQCLDIRRFSRFILNLSCKPLLDSEHVLNSQWDGSKRHLRPIKTKQDFFNEIREKLK